jgi:murein L,D-transpeptidase YafK
MDTHEDSYWIQCTRLRTKRHKKRMQREDADKLLIQKNKEEMVIWQAMRTLGWTELNPPVPRVYPVLYPAR